MSSLDKLLALTGNAPEAPDPDADLLLAAQQAARELAVLLASDDSDDGKGDGDDEGGGHADHPTYKALVKKNVPAARAAAMCARSDKKVKATALAQALEVMLAGSPGRDIGLVTLAAAPEAASASSRQQAAAAVLAGLSPGTAADGEKEAAAMLALARREAGPPMVAMHHAPMTGKHSHPHQETSAHDHEHEHWGDSNHSGGPLHRPGSEPSRGGW